MHYSRTVKEIYRSELNDEVDTRHLKSGKVRLRFKLSEDSFSIMHQAMKLIKSQYDHVCLDYVCVQYLSCTPRKLKLPQPCSGSKRKLFSLHKDQYETIRLALDRARGIVNNDAGALTLICTHIFGQHKFSSLSSPNWKYTI